MKETEKNIEMAQSAVGTKGDTISTSGVGSCVVITLYDPVNKVGGMAHAMLPVFQSNFTPPQSYTSAKYADTAIKELIKQMNEKGGNKSFYKAKLIGGAKMFKILGNDSNAIGQQNVEAAKKTLHEENIPLESEDTGGTIGRSVIFDLASGIVSVSTKM